MSRRKIVLIGAGSSVFTQGLVADLILSPDLGPWDLGLVDINEKTLEAITALVRRMIDEKGADITLAASTDRREILPKADIVVTTIAVGGRRAWEADVFIPRKYGVYQPVGDTVMPGGISRALRMIPAMVGIAKDIGQLCPQAWFFNYSNPMTAICRAIHKATDTRVTGLCHGVFGTEGYLARFAGLPPGDGVSSLAVGVNHLTFIYDFRWRGKDAWPLVRARLRKERDPSFDEAAVRREFPDIPIQPGETPKASDSPFSWSLFEAYGAFPAPLDRHTTEFFPERFPGGKYEGKTLGVDAFSFERTIEGGDRQYERMLRQARGEEPLNERLFQRAPGEHEQLLSIIRSLVGAQRRIFSVNLPNRGAVPGLPDDALLELPAVATGRGFSALQISDFPQSIAAILNRRIASQELTVEAALSGNRRLFVEALLTDGAVTDAAAAEKLSDDLLAAHREYLPQF
jgi:alpha-galactosidase